MLIILHASRTAMPSGLRVCIWLLKERAWLKTTDQSEARKDLNHSSLPLRSDPALAAVGGVLGTWLTFLWSFIINAFWANKRAIFKKINNIFSLTFCNIKTPWLNADSLVWKKVIESDTNLIFCVQSLGTILLGFN